MIYKPDLPNYLKIKDVAREYIQYKPEEPSE
jgi:hypothetical protein